MMKKKGLSKGAKEIKAQILKELAAEKAARPPELSEEPNFDLVVEAYDKLVEYDTSSLSTITETVDSLRVFVADVFRKLLETTMETLNDEILDEEAFKRKHSKHGLYVQGGANSLCAPPELEMRPPEDVIAGIKDKWKETLKGIEDGIAEKAIDVLERRCSADRLSLVNAKKRARNQLYASREVGQIFRNSFEDKTRWENAENIRVIEQRWEKKFHTETTELKDKIEHLQFRERLVTNKFRQAEQLSTQLADQLKETEDDLKVATLKIATLKAKKPHSHARDAHLVAHATHARAAPLSDGHPSSGTSHSNNAAVAMDAALAAPSAPIASPSSPVHKDPLGNEATLNVSKKRTTSMSERIASADGQTHPSNALEDPSSPVLESQTPVKEPQDAAQKSPSVPTADSSSAGVQDAAPLTEARTEARTEAQAGVGAVAEEARQREEPEQEEATNAAVTDSKEVSQEPKSAAAGGGGATAKEKEGDDDEEGKEEGEEGEEAPIEVDAQVIPELVTQKSVHTNDGTISIADSSAPKLGPMKSLSTTTTEIDGVSEPTESSSVSHQKPDSVISTAKSTQSLDQTMLISDILDDEPELQAEFASYYSEQGDGAMLDIIEANRSVVETNIALEAALSPSGAASPALSVKSGVASIHSADAHMDCTNCAAINAELQDLKTKLLFYVEHTKKVQSEATAAKEALAVAEAEKQRQIDNTSPLTIATADLGERDFLAEESLPTGVIAANKLQSASPLNMPSPDDIPVPPEQLAAAEEAWKVNPRTAEFAADEAMSHGSLHNSNRSVGSRSLSRGTSVSVGGDPYIDIKAMESPNEQEATAISPLAQSGGSYLVDSKSQYEPEASSKEPASPTSALGGNFSVLSTTYTEVIPMQQPVQVSHINNSGNSALYSHSHVGIEGTQGSLDLLSEYGLSTSQLALRSEPMGTVDAVQEGSAEVNKADGADGADGADEAASLEQALQNALLKASIQEGDSKELAKSTRADQKKLNKLIEIHKKSTQELEDKISSLQMLNNQINEKLRVKNNEKEHMEKLHSLQLLERGILLKELAKQVTELKTRLLREKAKSGRSGAPLPSSPIRSGGGVPISDVNSRRTSAEASARAKTPVILTKGVVLDDDLTLEKSAAQAAIKQESNASYSRMLANSKSMPMLTDDYSAFSDREKINSRVSSREAADQTYKSSGRIQSPFNTTHGKRIGSGKSGGLNFLPDILNPVKDGQRLGADDSIEALQGLHTMSQLGMGSTKDMKDALRAEELKSVRSQIVGILSERYPGPTNEQLLAVEKAKKRAIRDRELKLKAEETKKEAAEQARRAVRARAKKARMRDDDDDDLPRFG